VLSPWRRYSGYSTPRPVVTANALAFITLQPCRRDSIGKPFAPLLTAGTREFAPRRFTELANLIYREEHFEEDHICCAPTRWSLRGRKSKGSFSRYIFSIRCRRHRGSDYRSTVGATAPGYSLDQEATYRCEFDASDNATRNFTKVVQRIRVKIALDDPNLPAKLRPGLSVIATVRTRG
jgi:hypothetical protein